MANGVQKQWLTEVLGIAFGAPPHGGRLAPIPLRETQRKPPEPRFASVDGRRIWDEAVNAVHAELMDLAGTFEEMDNADLDRIAARAPAELVDRLGRDIDTLLIGIDTAAPNEAEAARKAARTGLADCRGTVGKDNLITLLEKNPYAVPVNIRATLNAALDSLDKIVA